MEKLRAIPVIFTAGLYLGLGVGGCPDILHGHVSIYRLDLL